MFRFATKDANQRPNCMHRSATTWNRPTQNTSERTIRNSRIPPIQLNKQSETTERKRIQFLQTRPTTLESYAPENPRIGTSSASQFLLQLDKLPFEKLFNMSYIRALGTAPLPQKEALSKTSRICNNTKQLHRNPIRNSLKIAPLVLFCQHPPPGRVAPSSL